MQIMKRLIDLVQLIIIVSPTDGKTFVLALSTLNQAVVERIPSMIIKVCRHTG